MANSQTKLMYPGLAGFYDSMMPIAETFVRIVVGIMFLMHVMGKFNAGPAGVAANVMAKTVSSLQYCGPTSSYFWNRSAAFA